MSEEKPLDRPSTILVSDIFGPIDTSKLTDIQYRKVLLVGLNAMLELDYLHLEDIKAD